MSERIQDLHILPLYHCGIHLLTSTCFSPKHSSIKHNMISISWNMLSEIVPFGLTAYVISLLFHQYPNLLRKQRTYSKIHCVVIFWYYTNSYKLANCRQLTKTWKILIYTIKLCSLYDNSVLVSKYEHVWNHFTMEVWAHMSYSVIIPYETCLLIIQHCAKMINQ